MGFDLASQGNNARFLHVTCTFEGSFVVNARCSCRMLECEAIPCAHIFTVLRSLHVDTIPACCVMDRWTMQVTSAFPTERVTSTHVWSEQMYRFRGLRNKGNHALFKAFMSAKETKRVMEFFDDILDEDVKDIENTEATSFGPLPAYFSGANVASTSRVLNPKKIISKGAPPTNKRLRRFHESLRRD
uniref:Protein FAR1-RELATED SEQUENCE n=1 Tax=Arundo donax TaxID=35708 RepID=A0A0A9G6T5_ARUDO